MFVRKLLGFLVVGLATVSFVGLMGCQSTPKAHPDAFTGTTAQEGSARHDRIHHKRHFKGGMRVVRERAADSGS